MDAHPTDARGPWAMHIATWSVAGASITAVVPGGPLLTVHGLAVLVEEGRQEVIADDGSVSLDNICRITQLGAAAPDSLVSADGSIVVTGKHELGMMLTLAGDGIVGHDNNGSLEIEFVAPPRHSGRSKMSPCFRRLRAI